MLPPALSLTPLYLLHLFMQELINTSSSQTVELLPLYRHYITHQSRCIDLYSRLTSMLWHSPLNNFKAAWHYNAYQLQLYKHLWPGEPLYQKKKQKKKKKKKLYPTDNFFPQYHHSIEHSLACFTLLSINPFSVLLHSALALVSMSFLTTLH